MASNEHPSPVVDSKISDLFTSRLIGVFVNHALLAILDHSYIALLAIFLATPITSGGLGLNASQIGLILGLTGLVHGVVQTLCFAPLYRTFDPKKLYTFCISINIPVYASFPCINALARAHGLSYPGVWIILFLQLLLLLPSYTAFSTCLWILFFLLLLHDGLRFASPFCRCNVYLCLVLLAYASAAWDHKRPSADRLLIYGCHRPRQRDRMSSFPPPTLTHLDNNSNLILPF